jgi:hypothetical protein
MPTQHGHTFDLDMYFKDAGAVTADGAAQVSGADKIVNVGAGRFDATMMIPISAIDTATGDEGYVIYVQGSNSPTFASGIVNLQALRLGDAAVTLASADDTAGVYELPFTNEKNGTIYQYLRVYTEIAAAGQSINYKAYAVKKF